MHSVVIFGSPSRGRPQVAVYVATNAIGCPRRHIYEQPAIRQPDSIDNLIHINRMGVAATFWDTGIHDIKLLLIWRKTNAIGLV